MALWLILWQIEQKHSHTEEKCRGLVAKPTGVNKVRFHRLSRNQFLAKSYRPLKWTIILSHLQMPIAEAPLILIQGVAVVLPCLLTRMGCQTHWCQLTLIF